MWQELLNLDTLWFVLAGIIGGFLGGFLGIGGGMIFVPVLGYFVSKLGLSDVISVRTVLANSLFAIVFSGFSSSYKQYRSKNFYLQPVLNVAIPGIFTSLLLTYFINSGTWYNKKSFSIVFLSLLAVLLVRMLIRPKKAAINSNDLGVEEVVSWKYNLTGFFSGFISSLSGLGGGVVIVPILTNVIKLKVKQAISISTGSFPLLALALSIFYSFQSIPGVFADNIYHIGYLLPSYVFPMVVGVLISTPYGVKLNHNSDDKLVKLVFILVLALIAIQTVLKMFL
ncbi:MAG: sulfite exporter TauE/SafE family protein [Bacteroidota bacterium]|nr:sulfite exporter TauE/SafE family protein [Bacteroidota bacterium]